MCYRYNLLNSESLAVLVVFSLSNLLPFCVFELDEVLKLCLLCPQGGITHQDFAGHKGTIGVGDVQVIRATSCNSLLPVKRIRQVILLDHWLHRQTIDNCA